MPATKDRPSREPIRDDIPPLPSQPLRDDMVLNYADAAAYLRASPEQVERWVNLGWITSIKLNERATRVTGEQLREFIETRPRREAEPAPAKRGRPKIRTRHARAES